MLLSSRASFLMALSAYCYPEVFNSARYTQPNPPDPIYLNRVKSSSLASAALYLLASKAEVYRRIALIFFSFFKIDLTSVSAV